MPLQPIIVRSEPGIKRDGTKFEGNNYVDGQWVRFQRGLPRKIGGYRALQDRLDGIARGMHIHNHNGYTYVHIGTKDGVFRFRLDQNGNSSIVTNRTNGGYVSNANSLYQFDVAFNTTNTQNEILAHVAPNLEDISSDAAGQLFQGFDNGTSQLSLVSAVTVSGGIVALAPYVFAYGSDGFIQWSRSGYTDDWSGGDAGNARVTSQKIVKGLPLRSGAGNAPSGLFWSLDSVIRATYVGGAPVFQFDTITSQSSILSSQSVIEYDGIYFWCGVDRFLMFNGVVREVPNSLNLNWFYDNLNYAQRQKVFAFKVPRWGEIWWCYPRGNATECTHAVIYNVRENTWYDTELPNGGRSAGMYAQVFSSPLVVGVIDTETVQFRGTQDSERRVTEDGDPRIINDPQGYVVWQHEYGTDEINGAQIRPIRSWFETADMSLVASEQPQNMAIRVEYIEPDFVQSGNMTVEITGRANARSAEVTSDPKTIFANLTDRQQQLVYFREIRREMRFRFESNTIGGNYQTGQIIAHIEPATGTVLGENP
jgi:hypothetical protein